MLTLSARCVFQTEMSKKCVANYNKSLKGQGHSKKYFNHRWKVYIKLSYWPFFELLKCIQSLWNLPAKKPKIRHRTPPFWIVLCSLAAYTWHHSVQDQVCFQEGRHIYMARLLTTIQNGGTRCWILGFFGDKFHKDRVYFRSSENGM